MIVRLMDGTWELFRHYFAIQRATSGSSGSPGENRRWAPSNAAARGALSTVLGLLESGTTHIGVATDHTIESFRNGLWPGYKSSESVAPDLLRQIPLLESGLEGLGVVVWPMVELEADDALASAAVCLAEDARVDQVLVDSPDKDLSQVVQGSRIVRVDRSRRPAAHVDEQAVLDRYGIAPRSLPDWLALVGDAADGYPGLKGWGPATASAVLSRYGHVAGVPLSASEWDVRLPAGSSGRKLADTLARDWDRAQLFLRLATLVVDRSLARPADGLSWHGPSGDFEAVCGELGAPRLAGRARAAWERQAAAARRPYPAGDA